MLKILFLSILITLCQDSVAHIRSVHKNVIINNGCYHNGTTYADGSLIPTLEPCLSCKCANKTLICSLKICSEMPVPPPRGCTLIQKKNTCCPYLSCSKFHNFPNIKRIITYLDHFERETLDRIVNENALRRRSDDFELDGLVCVQNGTVYKSGSAMSSSSLCSYCYCIGGTQKCVKPKCSLSMEGCKPIFVDSACCPVRYDCSSKSSNIMKSQNHARKTANNKHYQRMAQRLQRSRGCTINTIFYSEGQKIPSTPDKPCDICFCIKGSKKCAPKRCAPSIRNCLPVVPKGQCCPSSYECGYVKDVDRAIKSRQFDFFSLLFGSDEENSTEPYMNQHHKLNSPSKTSENSVFDTIREGLTFIDDNNDKLFEQLKRVEMKNDNVSSKVEIIYNSTDSLLSSAEFSDENLNIFDLFIDTLNTKNVEGNHSFGIIEQKNESFENIDSNEDFASENSYLFETTTNTQTMINVIPDLESEQIESFDYTTMSTSTEDDLTNTTKLIMESFTTESSFVDEHETTTIDNHVFTAKVEKEISDKMQTEESLKKDVFENSKNDTKILDKFANFNCTSKVTVNQTNNNLLLEKEPQKKLFTALFNGLKTLLQDNGNATNINFNDFSRIPSTVLLHASNVVKTHSSTFATPPDRMFDKIEVHSKLTTPPQNTVHSTPLDVFYNGEKNFEEASQKIKPLFPIIHSNPSILESTYESRTLPPSLPNLKIIPFLPTDAMQNDEKQPEFNYYPLITEKNVNSWIPSELPPYDSVYDSEVYLPDDMEYDRSNIESIKLIDPFKNYDIGLIELQNPPNYNFETLKADNKFTPPIKTEGGFIPKETFNDELLYENLYTTRKAVPSTSIHLLTGNKENFLANNVALNKKYENENLPIADSNKTSFYYNENKDVTPISITTESILPTKTKLNEDLGILKEALISSFDPLEPSQLNYESKLETIESTSQSFKDEIFLSKPFNKLPFMKPSYAIKQYNTQTHHNFELSFSNTESTIVRTEVFTKPENSFAGILKLAACNIYGRMYRVGRIILELSGPCLECKCTEIGVSCEKLCEKITHMHPISV